MKVVKKNMNEEKMNGASEENNENQGGNTPNLDNKTKNILATGLAVSMGVGTLLGGLSLVIYALRDVHVTLELKRNNEN
jgi:hypothetical protein